MYAATSKVIHFFVTQRSLGSFLQITVSFPQIYCYTSIERTIVLLVKQRLHFLYQNGVILVQKSKYYTIFDKTTITMNQRQEILQLLFENYVFTGNFSRLALLLGYTKGSRSTIGRIRRGESVSNDKTNCLWEKICTEFVIGESDIYIVAESIKLGKRLFSMLRDTHSGGSEWQDEGFKVLVNGRQGKLDKKTFKELKELKLETPDVYYGAVAYFYILCNNIFPYTGQGRKILKKQLTLLNETLHSMYPTNNRAYEGSAKSIFTNIADNEITILKLIYNLRVVIRSYTDDTYFENFLREQGHLLDVGSSSFWITPGETFRQGCTLWFFSVIETKSENRGAYIAMELRAESNSIYSFKLVRGYNFMFLVDGNGTETIQVLQACDLPSGEIGYTEFNYDNTAQRLELCLDNVPENNFGLPTVLELVDRNPSKGKEKKVWANIVNKIEDELCWKFLLEAVNSSVDSSIEYLADYDVTNVQIDRNEVVVFFESTVNGKEQYCIDADAYPFFKSLTPFEFASIVRHKERKELIVCWNLIGQYVPLKEFKKYTR